MKQAVLLGDEAIAMGAIDAGISTAYGYPGTPSTEIMEFLQNYAEKEQGSFHATWCTNEKTALEAALGTSLVGKRTLVTMKHVGLNVAADPFMNAANLKIQGGLVLVVADDPGMHSSQNEQDSRFFSDFAQIICLEPSTQQEAYSMTLEAFNLSERFQIPVMLRIVTRLAHSRTLVKLDKKQPENEFTNKINRPGWALLPANARRLFQERLKDQKDFIAYSEKSETNTLFFNPDFPEYGVLTTGIAKNYLEENLKDLQAKPSHLHIGTYPLPVDKIRQFVCRFPKIIVLEDGYPLLERYLSGILPMKLKILGKLDGSIPESGELSADNIRKALGLPERIQHHAPKSKLPGRPPKLCVGCPHTDTYRAINKIKEEYPSALVTSDIGCYALGALPPLKAVDSIVCMGASIGMAIGAADAKFFPILATIGDSTFLHSGLTALADACSKNSNITIIILDNSGVAMTGGQKSLVPSKNLRKIIAGIGVHPDHIREISPLPKNLEENANIIKEEINYTGTSVILSVRKCLHITC